MPPSLSQQAAHATRRRYRQVYAQLERFGADEPTAQLCASVVTHLETHGHTRIEHHEVAALAGVIGLICRCQAERAAREGTLAEAIA